MSAPTLLAIVVNAAMPAYTAWTYAAYALWPERFGDAWGEALAFLAIAQLPVAVLVGAAASFLYVEGTLGRRALVFGIVVGIAVVAGVVGFVVWDSNKAAIAGWTVAMQLTVVMVAGAEPELGKARIHAVSLDAVNLVVMTPFVGLLAIGAVFAAESVFDWRNPFDLSAIAWIASAYYVARTFSAIYVFGSAFDRRRKGFFVRDWIEKLLKPNPKESQN